MRGVNQAIIIGHLGNDPDIRYAPNGAAVANLSVATNRSWKDKESGEQKEQTEWHRIVAFGRTAEVIGEYLKKGAPVFIRGRLQTRKWTDKNDVERYTTEIVCEEIQFLGSKGDGQGYDKRAQQQAETQKDAPQQAQASNSADDEAPPFDDDLPF